jgi:hypothetical protein
MFATSCRHALEQHRIKDLCMPASLFSNAWQSQQASALLVAHFIAMAMPGTTYQPPLITAAAAAAAAAVAHRISMAMSGAQCLSSHSAAGAAAAAAAARRLIQEPGSFVLALPGAFTCSIATGFSLAEGLALAPWDWLGHGADAARKARLQGRRAAISMDQLLVTLVRVGCLVVTFGVGDEATGVASGSAGAAAAICASDDQGMVWASN